MTLVYRSTQNSPFIGGKNRNEFAEDVLSVLKRMKITFRGCFPDYVVLFLDGRVKVWFHGYRDGRIWRGGITFNCVEPKDRIYMADPAIVAEMCARHIALMNAG